MAAFLDACRFVPSSGGTTDWTYSSAVTGYQSPATAGVANGRLYKYRAESADLTQWEIGEGAYNTSTGILARTTVLFNSSGTSTKINFTVSPQVAIVALKEDLLSIEEANSFTLAQTVQARKNLKLDQTAFSASLSASQAATNGTFVKVRFDSELNDPLGWYDNATNYRFQPTIAGLYQISGAVQGNGTTISEVDLDIYLNGASYARALGLTSGVANSTPINKLVSLNGSTDYVELWGNVVGTGSLLFLGGSGPIRTWFEARLIG